MASAPPPKKNKRTPLLVLAAGILCCVLVVTGVTYTRAAPSTDGAKCADHEELLIGYKMLAHILDQETQLKHLHLMRDATFRSPSSELARLIILIHKTAKKHKLELKGLRNLEPVVMAAPKPSKIGDSIQDIAENAGKMEMIFPGGSFDMRFMFLQAQATRMIISIAKAIEKLECNGERVHWLKEIQSEFEDVRDELVVAVDTCQF